MMDKEDEKCNVQSIKIQPRCCKTKQKYTILSHKSIAVVGSSLKDDNQGSHASMHFSMTRHRA